MCRIKVAIVFGDEPNFDQFAFKNFILYLNKVQETFEYAFPDIRIFPFTSKSKSISFKECINIFKDFLSNQNIIVADHIICITKKSFDNHYFFNVTNKTSIITTDIWDKAFSPPSLFEYLLHSIHACLVFSQVPIKSGIATDEGIELDITSHSDTRGCLMDFTRNKNDDRIDISLGYICDDHKTQIMKYYGDEYLNDVNTIIGRKWIGDLSDRGSLAYDLMHIYKFNIFKDSGLDKNRWDKIKEFFYEVPSKVTSDLLVFILGAIITYILVKLGVLTP